MRDDSHDPVGHTTFKTQGSMAEAEETTPPNSPRRRRITTNGTSKTLKIPHHPSSDEIHPPPTSSLNSLAATTHSKPTTVPPAATTVQQSENDIPQSESLSWHNLKDCNKSVKIEKFLWDANISDEIGKTDDLLLKVCTMKTSLLECHLS
jgi:hypothetical protein